MRILFATPEVSDFVQVGGLAAVSAALPRALRSFADVRVIIPGYPAVLRGLKDLQPIGRCQPFAALPAFEVGLGHSADGLSYFVVRCRELYEREGTPYADGCGADWSDNNVRFATFSYAAAQLARRLVDKDWQAGRSCGDDCRWRDGLSVRSGVGSRLSRQSLPRLLDLRDEGQARPDAQSCDGAGL